jgi:hypothetical protein
MKILFLDIDGVLNSSDYYRKGRILSKTMWNHHINQIDPEAVKYLNEIVEKSGCKIVISSTWRKSDSEYAIAEMLRQRGFKYPESVVDRTPVLNHERGQEIKAWWSEHPEVTEIVILDDDVDMEPLMDKLVFVNFLQGLQDIHVLTTVQRFKNV